MSSRGPLQTLESLAGQSDGVESEGDTLDYCGTEAMPFKMSSSTRHLATDYDALCAPHISAVRAVLAGEQYRYKLHVEDAIIIFHHGCLMGRIWLNGQRYALPPLALDESGQPYFYAIPSAQRSVWVEFCQLPKGILLFYFSLLKRATRGLPLYLQSNPQTQATQHTLSVPAVLHPWLKAVDWRYVSIATV